ncbi:MAG: TonB-dependent receptor [Spongiibacteraceae bacterium]
MTVTCDLAVGLFSQTFKRTPASQRLLPCTLSSLLFMAIGDVRADDIAASRENLTVTATRTEVPLSRLGGTVIDAEAILQPLPYSTLEVLNNVAGLHAFQKGGMGGSSYLSVRGGEPNYTLVLLSGVKVNDPANSQGGSFDMNQIDPAALSRIDIYRGALSAVHGADALSGVVNLQLRGFSDGEFFESARISTDTEAGRGASGSLGAGWNDGSILLSASWADSGDLTGASTQDRRQFIARLTQELGSVRSTATVLNGSSNRESFPEDSGGERLAANRELETVDAELTVVDLDFSRAEAGAIQPHLKASWNQQVADTDTPAIFPGVLDFVPAITADTEFERVDITADIGVQFSEMLSAVVGGSYVEEDGTSRGAVDFGVLIPAEFDIHRTLSSFFAEVTVAPIANFSATVGARYDDPSSHDSEWTSRLSLSWQPFENLPALYANASESYKLPSLYALAYPLIANPDLKPERSESVDAGLQQHFDNGTHVRLGYFRIRFEDVIDFDSNLFTNVNRAWAISEGVEAELHQPLGESVLLSLNATYLDLDAIDAVRLRSRPMWQGGVALDWNIDSRWTAFANLHYESGYYDSSIPTGLIETASHVTVNTGATVKLSPNFSLAVVLKNLLDEDYEQSVGTAAPGRMARLALTYLL